MPSVYVDGAVVDVLVGKDVGGRDVIMLSSNPLRGGIVLLPAQAAKLRELIDTAASAQAPRGLVGSASTIHGGLVHVVRAAYHVCVNDHPDPSAHSGWIFRLDDQVLALRDALAEVVGSSSSTQQTPTPCDERAAQHPPATPQTTPRN